MTETPAAPIRKKRDPKPTPERIQQLANRVLEGDIALPEFQRQFVWDRSQILKLLDSIYRNYPIGSLLVWESSQDLKSKRSIADLQIADRSETYPINYLLDGQQRLSTVCGVLHWKPGEANSVWNVVFDLKERAFFHSDSVEEPALHIIPMRRLSVPADFFRKISPLTDPELIEQADILFNRFTEYQVALVTLGDMPLEDIAPVFERINSTGTRLTIFDLMRAATWSTSFDLGQSVDEIKGAIEPKRFSGIDEKVLLRALSAAAGPGFTAENINSLRDKKEDDLKQAVEDTTASAIRACDFLATEVGVPRSEAIPYVNQFAVLCEVFRLKPVLSSDELKEVRGWFWRTTLTGYFGGWNSGQMSRDATAVRDWAAGSNTKIEIGASVVSNDRLWRLTAFRSNSAISKMAGLMLSAAQPLDALNGQKIDFDKSLAWSNDKEYHHFFPQAYLERNGIGRAGANVIANIVLLTSVSNIKIKDRAPSEYLSEIIERDGREAVEQRLATSLISPQALDAALKDDYDAFLDARSATLQEHALQLCAESGSGELTETADPSDVDEESDSAAE